MGAFAGFFAWEVEACRHVDISGLWAGQMWASLGVGGQLIGPVKRKPGLPNGRQ